MKKTLLGLSLIAFALVGKAQNCSDLIISEYLEGTGNNKALEFYNASSNSISLASYRVIRWDNGSTTADGAPEGIMNLPTNITLAPYQTYVVGLNFADPNLVTGSSGPVIDPALQAKCDTLLCPGCTPGTGLPRVMCFNGDDALSLQKNVGGNWTNIDIFAIIGERPENSGGTYQPGAGWTSLTPYFQMPSSYDSGTQGPYFKQYITQDKTLRRKSTVKAGVSSNPSFGTFNALVQWDSTGVDVFSGLGIHQCDCQLVGVKEINKSFVVSLYPNPAKNIIQLSSSNFINKLMITSVTGQTVKTLESNTNMSGAIINVSDLVQGIYFIILQDNKNHQSVKKLIIE